MELVEAAHRRLIDSLHGLTDEQVRQPSLLPDWTVGHTLSHIALNAEALVNVTSGIRQGLIGLMYPSIQSRNDAIEAGAKRSASEITMHLERAGEALESIWATLTPRELAREAATVSGMPTFPASSIPMLRLREIEVHGSDTGLPGLSIAKWSDAYVDADLPIQLAKVPERLGHWFAAIDEDGMVHVAEPQHFDRTQGGSVVIDQRHATTLVSTRREILAWCLNRSQPEGFPPLGPWQTPPSSTP